MLARLTGLPILVVGFGLIAPDGYASLVSGQIVPPVIFAPLAEAGRMRDERYVAATVFLGIAMIEPHVAMPKLAAKTLFVPRMRIALAAVIGALVVISFVAVSPAAVSEYVARVSPAHARSEVGGSARNTVSRRYSLRLASAPTPRSAPARLPTCSRRAWNNIVPNE